MRHESVFRVRGRVQGVFFRARCRALAIEQGLGGWVRNEADGSVLLCLRGDAKAIKQMMGRLRALREPAGARVEAIELESQQQLRAPAGGFQILE